MDLGLHVATPAALAEVLLLQYFRSRGVSLNVLLITTEMQLQTGGLRARTNKYQNALSQKTVTPRVRSPPGPRFASNAVAAVFIPTIRNCNNKLFSLSVVPIKETSFSIFQTGSHHSV